VGYFIDQIAGYLRVQSEAPEAFAVEQNPGGEFGQILQSMNQTTRNVLSRIAISDVERDRYRKMIDQMEEGVIALDERFRVLAMNQSALQLFNVLESPTKRPFSEIVRVPVIHDLLRDLGRHDVRTADFEIGEKEKIRHVMLRVSRSANPVGYVLLVVDVSELKKLETIRRDFVANVSHELRTPISVIRANSETLLEGAMDDPKFSRRFIEGIFRNSERLSDLVEDLLDLSRIESGKLDVVIEMLSVGDVLNQVLDNLRDKLEKKGITVCVEVRDELIQADKDCLVQILTNYIDNASKYCSVFGARIKVGCEQDQDNVLLYVEDNGPGVAPEHRERLFERFYRIDKGRSRDIGGTGLGLAIVKHLGMKMGGEVGMRPADNQGSVFWLKLPRV